MLDIWVDIITLEILNMARDGYGLDTILHNDYVAEIKKKTKDNMLCFLAEHDTEIRRQAVDEFIDRFNKSTIIMGRGFGRTFMLKCLNDIAEQMRGETE